MKVKFLMNIFQIILLSSIFPLIFSKAYSLTGEQFNISNNVSSLIFSKDSLSNENNKTFSLHEINLKKFSFSRNEPFKFPTEYYSMNFGIDFPMLTEIYFNNVSFNKDSINYSYIKHNKPTGKVLIPPILEQKNTFNTSNPNIKKDIEIKANLYPIEAEVYKKKIKHFSKIISMDKYLIGLHNDDKLLYVIKDQQYLSNNKNYDIYEKDILLPIKDYNDDEVKLKVKDFFISKDSFNEYSTYLLVYFEERKMMLYKLEYIENEENENEYEINPIFSGINRSPHSDVVIDFKIRKKVIYLSYQKYNAIFMFDLELNTYSETFHNDIEEDFLSFVFYGNYLYAIQNNTGLICFHIIELNAYKYIFLSHAKKIESFISPFSGKIYFEVLLDNNSTDNSFLIEFYVKEELILITNKVFTSPNNLSFLFYDYYFMYFLNLATNEILLTRIGVDDNVPFFIYSVPTKIKFDFMKEKFKPYLIKYYGRNGEYLTCLVTLDKNDTMFLNLYKLNINQYNEVNVVMKKKGYYIMEMNNLYEERNLTINSVNSAKIYIKEREKKIDRYKGRILFGVLFPIGFALIVLGVIWIFFIPRYHPITQNENRRSRHSPILENENNSNNIDNKLNINKNAQ